MNSLPARRRVKGLGRVAFIANLREITAELEAGWPIKAVYDKRAARLGMSYAQFARYVDQIVGETAARGRSPALVSRRHHRRRPPAPSRARRRHKPSRNHACRTPRRPRLQPRPHRKAGRPQAPPRRRLTRHASCTSSCRARAALVPRGKPGTESEFPANGAGNSSLAPVCGALLASVPQNG